MIFEIESDFKVTVSITCRISIAYFLKSLENLEKPIKRISHLVKI